MYSRGVGGETLRPQTCCCMAPSTSIRDMLSEGILMLLEGILIYGVNQRLSRDETPTHPESPARDTIHGGAYV